MCVCVCGEYTESGQTAAALKKRTAQLAPVISWILLDFSFSTKEKQMSEKLEDNGVLGPSAAQPGEFNGFSVDGQNGDVMQSDGRTHHPHNLAVTLLAAAI